jgi:hypothetical protein
VTLKCMEIDIGHISSAVSTSSLSPSIRTLWRLELVEYEFNSLSLIPQFIDIIFLDLRVYQSN